jgi:hypothetical protein
MAATDHYALLLAINHYPGLSDLAGPENDALAFREWLLDPDGGALEPGHLALIKSSDFADTPDPYDANPTDSQLKKVLNQWLKVDGKWRDHVGQRIYLFFAGHGFTAGTLTDPVLFTAQAQLDDRTYIAAYRYAGKIVNAGFFDEVVLIMDCCQDVLKAATIAEPSWSPPDRMCSDRVQFMVALGAPRGRKAFEQSSPPQAAPPGAPPAAVHGYFSSVFLDALRTAPSDAQGDVTARAVEATFGTLWTQRYLERTGYEPPFIAPRDMKLYRRASAVAISTSGLAAAKPAAPTQSIALPVNIASIDSMAQIRVFDERHRVVGNALGALRLKLPQGEYIARVRLGGGVGSGATVHDHPLTIQAPSMGEPIVLSGEAFASAVPAQWSTSRHGFQQGPATQWTGLASQISPWPDSVVTLMVFARDSAHQHGKPWRMETTLRQGLRLKRIIPGTGDLMPVPLQLHVDADRAFTAFKIDLPAGSYVLGAKRRLLNRWVWDEIVLTLASGRWRTEVWLDCEDDEQDQRRFDVDTASVLVSHPETKNWFNSPAARTTELLRSVLVQHTMRQTDPIAAWDDDWSINPEEVGPMAVLYAAMALTLQTQPDTRRLRDLTQWLATRWSAHSADVQLLTRWGDLIQGPHGSAPLPALNLAPDAVPMLNLTWRLVRNRLLNVRLSRSTQQTVGLWRTEGECWLHMQRPDSSNRAPAPAKLPQQLPHLPNGDLDLARIADNLSRPDASQSPLHQTLRNQLIDARDCGEAATLAQVVDSVAIAAALDTDVVLQALGDLLAAPHESPSSA